MDLRAYYRNIREVESTIPTPFIVVVALDTPEGGKAGTCSETTRFVAAKLVAEGRAKLASEEQTKRFYEQHAEARREAEANAAAQRMQVTIVGTSELRQKPGKAAKE